jgi:hypothetical protein
MEQFADLIAKKISVVAEAKRNLATARKSRKTFGIVEKLISSLPCGEGWSVVPSILSDGEIYITVQANVDSFNTGAVPENLEYFLTMIPKGYQVNVSSRDYPQYSQRIYTFGYYLIGTSSWNTKIRVDVTCNLKDEGSETCKRVVVSEKEEIVVRKEYKFVCS